MNIRIVIPLISLYFITGYSLDIRLPPSIVEQPKANATVKRESYVTLRCGITGDPKPNIIWKFNFKELVLPNIAIDTNEDKSWISIKKFDLSNEGYYQCTVDNQYGTAVSDVLRIRMAELYASPNEKPRLLHFTPGEPYVIEYIPFYSVPAAIVTWATAKAATGASDEGTTLTLSRRVQIDDKGNLHFAHVVTTDNLSGQVYKARSRNHIIDTTSGGSYTTVIVSNETAKLSAPRLAFSTSSPLIALEGKTMSLRCFFYSNPESSMLWKTGTGSPLPQGRYQTSEDDTQLIISSVEQSDEKNYICQGFNGEGVAEHTIQVDVQAIPMFKNVNDAPHDMNVTEGQTVTVSCNAYAEPVAKITWFINGVPVDSNNLRPKYRLDNNGKQLTVENVCKVCDKNTIGRTTDLVVIQCNASNVHGYAFSSGYINVLKKTIIEVPPENIIVKTAEDTSALFPCSFVSDPATPANNAWYPVVDGEQRAQLVALPNEIVLAADGSLEIIVNKNSTKTWADHVGTYRCIAKSIYSEDIAEALLSLDKPPEPLRGGIADFWWIFLIIALILILIIVICCCCLYRQRNKGESYPVDEKEQENGNDPEKELLDSGFHDYQRSDMHQGSKASLASSAHLHSDDDVSLQDAKYTGYSVA